MWLILSSPVSRKTKIIHIKIGLYVGNVISDVVFLSFGSTGIYTTHIHGWLRRRVWQILMLPQRQFNVEIYVWWEWQLNLKVVLTSGTL